jgi:hypothetical protein
MKITTGTTAYSNQVMHRIEEFDTVNQVAERIKFLAAALDQGEGTPFTVHLRGTWIDAADGDLVFFGEVNSAACTITGRAHKLFITRADGNIIKVRAQRGSIVVLVHNR